MTKCKDCRFFSEEATSDLKLVWRECHRNAPIIDTDDGGAKWPVVRTIDWCGQFEPKEVE